MEKKIEDLTDSEMMAVISALQESYVANPEILRDEVAYPTDELIDVMTVLFYLERSGQVADATNLFSSLYKDLENEIAVRIGDVPYLTQ